MKLQWLGHSAFRLIESTGSSIIIDPFKPSSVGYSMAYLACDAITESSDKDDHNYTEGVKGKPVVINKPGTYEIKGIGIDAISSSENDETAPLIFKYRLDGVTVCHFGDIIEDCSPDLVEELLPVNVLLLPVGGRTTLDAEQAKEFVDKLMPDVVIPMRFKTKSCELDIDKADAFLKLFDDEDVSKTEHTIEFDRFDFNGDTTKVYVPARYKG